MTPLVISCVVEGHGDREAIPVLVRRIATELDPSLSIQIPRPIRIPKTRLVRPGELERAVELAARKTRGRGGVLVVVDADDDRPGKVGPDLAKRARKARSDTRIGVVLAKREFEAWFLAAAGSLGRGLQAPDDPEAIRGAKEWLRHELGTYSETVDQPALAAVVELRLARTTSDSFDKCWREVAALLTTSRPRDP